MIYILKFMSTFGMNEVSTSINTISIMLFKKITFKGIFIAVKVETIINEIVF